MIGLRRSMIENRRRRRLLESTMGMGASAFTWRLYHEIVA
jgi:hypothetical protein